MKRHHIYFTVFFFLTSLKVMPGSDPIPNLASHPVIPIQPTTTPFQNTGSTALHTIPFYHDQANPIRNSVPLIHDPPALSTLRRGIDHIYNNEFREAEKSLDTLNQKYANHPVSSFFEGLIIYWTYYPLAEGHPGFEEFGLAMKESYERSDSLKHLETDTESLNAESANAESTNPESANPGNPAGENFSPNEIEGVFFELVSRAFLVMNYADNGRSSHTITHFPAIYRDILKGMEMQAEFPEFMFITGLYNYYREAYPEAYPVYKVPLVFFRRGDKAGGLTTLRRAANETDFLRIEATQFLSLIHINFENNPDSSLFYSSLLHKTYPGNAYFHAKFAEMLLINREYERALVQIAEMLRRDSYNRMKAAIYRGIYEEKHKKDQESARVYYEEGLRLAEPFGDRANYSKAYAYIGLSRYYENMDDGKKAKEYYKMAKNSSGYEYVFK